MRNLLSYKKHTQKVLGWEALMHLSYGMDSGPLNDCNVYYENVELNQYLTATFNTSL